MEEEPAATEPRAHHHSQGAGVSDQHVAPHLPAGLEDAVKLSQGGALVGQHMEPVEAEEPVDAAVPQRQPKRVGAGEEDVVAALGGTLSDPSTEHPGAEVDADVGALQG